MKQKSHTGNEIELLLSGMKPLAAFVEFMPNDVGLDLFPERQLDSLVAEGKFVKRMEEFKAPDGAGTLRRTLYAISSEAWRIDAYLSLWRLQEVYGWNAGFELMEGFLLGYEDRIDPFFSPSVPKDEKPACTERVIG